MPYVLEFNRPAIDGKLTRLAAWLELPDPSFEAVQNWVLALRQELGIPHTLKDIGVGDDRIDQLAEMAEVDPAGGGNPVPLDAANLKTMCLAAQQGVLG